MSNYRGGPRVQSSYGAELVKAIREGRTERQRSRNFNQKLMMGIGQAGLTGLRGAVEANESFKKTRAAENAELRKSAKQYAAPDYQGGEGSVPAWLGERGSDGDQSALQETMYGHHEDVQPYRDDWENSGQVKSKAERALENQSTNSLAYDANPDNDELSGGMMKSLPRGRGLR